MEQRVFKVKLPMRIKTSSKKKQALNLNVYRNLHFRSLTAQKNKFYEIARKLLKDIPPLGVVTLHYDVCPKTKRRLDIMNPGSIVDKYFSDTLTESGVILDDSLEYIPHVSFAFGGYADEEHILVTITEIEPRRAPVKVLLDQNDIQEALTTYVASLNIPNAGGVMLSITDDGKINAEVTFLPSTNEPTVALEDEAVEDKPKKRGRGGRPAGSKNKPKVSDPDPEPKEADDVGTPVQDGADSDGGGTTPSAEGEVTPDVADEGETPAAKSTSRKNLFGAKDDPSSEDDGKTEAPTGDTPDLTKEPEATPVKRGSIFDN